MGSGFNFFTNGIDKTPSTTGQFTDVDVSGDGVPSGATGVILKIVNTGTAGRGEVRKNGSTDDFGLTVQADQGRYALVGVDANRIFEAYIAATTMKIYLIGYADENCGFFDNAIDKTPATTGSWQDVDVSGDIPSESTGVICLLYNSHASLVYSGGIRKNGSTDTYPYGQIRYGSCFYYQLCGVDAYRIFEAQIQNTALKVMLVGYTKSPVTFFDNGIDKSLSTAGAWTDIDVTAETANDADGAIVLMKNTNTGTEYIGDVRKNGGTDNHVADMKIGRGGCAGAPIGMDSEQIFEGYIENTAVDFYLIGYCKPAAGVTYIDVSDSGGGADALAALEASMLISESGSGFDSVPSIGIPVGDSGSGLDAISMQASLSLSDSGTGTDTAIAGVPVDVTDSGVGSDMITQLQASIPIGDAGFGSDVIATLQAQLSILESGLGSETWTLTLPEAWAGLFGELEIIESKAVVSVISPSGAVEIKHPTGEMEIIKR